MSPLASAKAPRARFCALRVPFIFSATRLAWSQSPPACPYSSFISEAARTKNAFTSSSSGRWRSSCAADLSASRAPVKSPWASFGEARFDHLGLAALAAFFDGR